MREPLRLLLLLLLLGRRPRGKHRSPLVGDDSRRAGRDGACHHAIEQPPPDKVLPRTQRVRKQCLAIVPPLSEPRECQQTAATAAATAASTGAAGAHPCRNLGGEARLDTWRLVEPSLQILLRKLQADVHGERRAGDEHALLRPCAEAHRQQIDARERVARADLVRAIGEVEQARM